MTYQECKAIALENNPNVNACYEYDNAYRFFEKCDIEVVGDFEVVVLDKEGGYHEIEDVLFSKHASGVLTVTIIQGEKFLY